MVSPLAGRRGLGIQIPVQVRVIAPTPHHRYGQHQQPEVRKVVPMKMSFQGPKKLVKRGGNPYDPEHGVILLSLRASGRLHTLPSCGPRMASPAAAVKPSMSSPSKKSVNVSTIVQWQTNPRVPEGMDLSLQESRFGRKALS